MNVMMYLGNATPKIVNALRSMSDDVDYTVYTSVPTFVQEVELRHLSFNRVIFNLKFVQNGEEDFIKLNNLIREFANSTELVMVINQGDKESEALFNKFFASPMHSCAIVKGAVSMDFFRDMVSLPIPDIKARYYVLDKVSKDAVTSKPKEPEESELGGSIKNSPRSEETFAPQSNGTESGSNSGGFSANGARENAKPFVPEPYSNGGGFGANGESGLNNGTENPVFNSDGGSLGEQPSSTPQDFMGSDDEDSLSVGEFGIAHSDTDMFDEEEEPEEDSDNGGNDESFDEAERRRKEELEEQNKIAERIQEEKRRQEALNSRRDAESRRVVSNRDDTREKQWELGVYQAGKVNIITGIPCSGATQRIVDDAVRMMERGQRVLIVDMDFVNNSILSFIDTAKFYKTCGNGYSRGKLYVEDNISILSGGYGFVPSVGEITNALSTRGFDIILVDCPVSSLNKIVITILERCNIIVYSNNDPSKIIATSLGLTNRANCSLSAEKLIMKSCRTLLEGDYKGNIFDVVGSLFFANGCWIK